MEAPILHRAHRRTHHQGPAYVRENPDTWGKPDTWTRPNARESFARKTPQRLVAGDSKPNITQNRKAIPNAAYSLSPVYIMRCPPNDRCYIHRPPALNETGVSYNAVAYQKQHNDRTQYRSKRCSHFVLEVLMPHRSDRHNPTGKGTLAHTHHTLQDKKQHQCIESSGELNFLRAINIAQEYSAHRIPSHAGDTC